MIMAEFFIEQRFFFVHILLDTFLAKSVRPIRYPIFPQFSNPWFELGAEKVNDKLKRFGDKI